MPNQEEINQVIEFLKDKELANWSHEKGDPIFYEHPSSLTFEPCTLHPIKDLKKEHKRFEKCKYSKEFDVYFSVYSISLLTNAHTFDLLKDVNFYEGSNDGLELIEEFEVIIDYPLEKPCLVKFKPLFMDGRNITEIGYIMWQISQAYLQIYKNHETWGVWGHSIHDLVFEGIHINKEGQIYPLIGS